MQLDITNGLLTLLQWPHFQMVMMVTGYVLLMTAFIISHNNYKRTVNKFSHHYKKLYSNINKLDESTQELCTKLDEFNCLDQYHNYAIRGQSTDINKIAERQLWQVACHIDAEQTWINWTDLLRLTADDESLAFDLIAQLVNEIPKITHTLEQIHTLTFNHRALIHQWLGLFRMTGVVRMSERLEAIKARLLQPSDQISTDDQECLIADLRDLLVESFMLIKHNSSTGYRVKKLA